MTHEAISLLLATVGTAADNATRVQSVFDFVQKGGYLMYPIGLCSFVAVTVFIERLISLRRRSVIPSGFLAGLRKAMAAGPDHRKAVEYCRRSKSPVGNVFLAGIRRMGQPPDLVEKQIVEAGQREVLKLRRNLRVLSVIAAVSPLLGLLGTIFGMIEAFETVATSGEALGRTEVLASGIYQAMITTAAGLIVAIPTLVGYHFLAARVEKLVMEIDHMTVEFLDEFAHGTPTGTDSAEAPAPARARDGAIPGEAAPIAT